MLRAAPGEILKRRTLWRQPRLRPHLVEVPAADDREHFLHIFLRIRYIWHKFSLKHNAEACPQPIPEGNPKLEARNSKLFRISAFGFQVLVGKNAPPCVIVVDFLFFFAVLEL